MIFRAIYGVGMGVAGALLVYAGIVAIVVFGSIPLGIMDFFTALVLWFTGLSVLWPDLVFGKLLKLCRGPRGRKSGAKWDPELDYAEGLRRGG